MKTSRSTNNKNSKHFSKKNSKHPSNKNNKKTSKKTSKKASKKRITTRLETKKISIKINKKIYKSKILTYIKLSSNGTVYISWVKGVTYFKLNSKDKQIQNLKKTFAFDDENKTFKFIYSGQMENNMFSNSGKSHKVKHNYIITFDNEKEYYKFKKYIISWKNIIS